MEIINKQESARQIYLTLKQRIVEWKYLPGQRLTEERISSEFGVSRSPAREALRMLIENNYVEKEAYKGYHIANIDLKFISNLYELRLALELYTVSKASEKMNSQDWNMLYDFWSQDANLLEEDANALTLEDERFHLVIAKQTNNKLFIQRLESIFERLRVIRIYDFSSLERTIQTFQQHKKILDCIKAHQVEEAQKALVDNIKNTEDEVERSVASALSKSYLKVVHS